jgi:hypothetical protein
LVFLLYSQISDILLSKAKLASSSKKKEGTILTAKRFELDSNQSRTPTFCHNSFSTLAKFIFSKKKEGIT